MISINSSSFRFKRPAPRIQEFNIFLLLSLVMVFDDARDRLTFSCWTTFITFCPLNNFSFDWCSKRNIFLSVGGEGRHWYWNSSTQNLITRGNIVLWWWQYLKLYQTTGYINSDSVCSCNMYVYRLHTITHTCLRILHERLGVSAALILAVNVFKIAKVL